MNYKKIKNEFLDNEFKFQFINNKLDIVNYKEVISFTDNTIIIKYNEGILYVNGDNLVISRLLLDELLIKGNINKIEFR